MKFKLKSLLLVLSLIICMSVSTITSFAKNNTKVTGDENIEMTVTVNSNMWKDKEGFYSENKEIIMVIPTNTIVYIQENPQDVNYALVKYKDEFGKATFGYVSKDNLKF